MIGSVRIEGYYGCTWCDYETRDSDVLDTHQQQEHPTEYRLPLNKQPRRKQRKAPR